MLTVEIHEADLYEMLCDRVEYHFDRGTQLYNLFCRFYDKATDDGRFDHCVLDIKAIVDNDVVNNTAVVEKGDADYKKLLALYDDGEYDVSEIDFDGRAYQYIECLSDDGEMILCTI
jgi:hypothetical protein